MSDLLLADSFRVMLTAEGPVVVALEQHLARFTEGVTALIDEGVRVSYGTAPTLSQWIDDALDSIDTFARTNDGAFPRLECVATHITSTSATVAAECGLTLRPAPHAGESIALVSQPAPPRPHPDRKGPNIARYAQLTADASGEVLFTDGGAEHTLIEGTTTSLVWWEGDTLVRVPTGVPRVHSVTEALLLRIADECGITTRAHAPALTELLHHEVWALNALHGIRPVTSIDGIQLSEPDTERLTRARQLLVAKTQSLVR